MATRQEMEDIYKNVHDLLADSVKQIIEDRIELVSHPYYYKQWDLNRLQLIKAALEDTYSDLFKV